MPLLNTAAPAVHFGRIDPFLSQKLRFWSLMGMVLLVYVHAYNLHPRYLHPWTPVDEPLSFDTWTQYFLANGQLRFRVPILFAISGYLSAHNAPRMLHSERVRRRFRTLVIPYLAWSALGMAFTWGLEQFGTTKLLVLAASVSPFGAEAPLVSHFSPWQFLIAWLLLPVPYQLWFIRSLIVYNLIYPWLSAVIERVPKLYFFIAALLWLGGLGLFVVEGTGLLFFGLGVWLRRNNVDVQTAPSWFRPWLFGLLWIALLALKTWLAFYLVKPPYSLMSVLHRTGEILGVLVMWFGTNGLVRVAMRQAWFIWLTGLSFIIYVLHAPLMNYATEVALHYGQQVPHIHLLTYLVMPLLIIGLSISIGALLRWVLPGLYSVLTGNRGLTTA